MTDTNQLSTAEAISITKFPTEDLPDPRVGDSQVGLKAGEKPILKVTSFVSDGNYYRLDPALEFLCEYDPESEVYTFTGFGVYKDVLVYGETLTEAKTVLLDAYIPMLWELYANEEDSNLDLLAQELKYDFKTRVR